VRRPDWTPLILACIVVSCVRPATAQAPASKPPPAKAQLTTLSGVYTTEQASRGKEVYAGYCINCHTAASHTGATFRKWWAGRRMSDLFEFVSGRMPKNEPGSLAPEEYADVIAYLMKMNVMPPGKAELPADATELQKIRIVSPTKSTKGIKKP
jgi:mono/diheme cytochrome c family protein